MLQRFNIALVRTIANTFFRRIDVVGLENVPPDGAVIFAGNHPNALMDGWLLTAKCGRSPLHFMVNAKLWNYRILAPFLNASGAVPVYPRAEHGADTDNSAAFRRLFEVLADGRAVGIFPEGVSHVESQLAKLKTGTARLALTAAAEDGIRIAVVPAGLNYIHRHRFRSQVQIEFGKAIVIDPAVADDHWLRRYRRDARVAVEALTEHLAQAIRGVTVNAPDWSTLRFVQAARRLYKPATANLTPDQYVELTRRFLDGWQRASTNPRMIAFKHAVEDYQTRLDVLGFKDHQLRKDLSTGQALARLTGRALMMLVLLPLAIPGALLHLPVGWVAASVGERLSYEQDDVATIKVFATIALLPVLYGIVAWWVWQAFGVVWAVAVVVALIFSFSASIWLIEAQASLLFSILSILRRTRLRAEIDNLRSIRAQLVDEVRSLADEFADPVKPRIFSALRLRIVPIAVEPRENVVDLCDQV